MSLDLWFTATRETTVGDFNITHNLTDMAEEAGIYEILWHPENSIRVASDMIDALERGIADMKEKPLHYRSFDSTNGWGTYDNFLPWCERILECCKANPDAKVRASI